MILRILFVFIYVIKASKSDNQTDELPIISSCDTYLKLFADAASNMTSCIVEHSRPFSVCRSCLQQYLSCQAAYDILLKTTTGDSREMCSKRIAHQDHVQMVVRVHDFVTDSWESNYCASCYEKAGSANHSNFLANSTQQFLERLATFDLCIYDNLGKHLPYIIPGKLSVNQTVCSTCLSSYKNLSDFYSHLDPLFDCRFCMDLSDAMNFTWNVWHEDFHCYLHYRSLDVCVGTSVLIALLPVLFYFVAKLCASDITKIFLIEKRLRRQCSDVIQVVADT